MINVATGVDITVEAIADSVRDVLGKSLGSANPINTAWATIRALQALRSPTEVAQLRGVEVSRLQLRSFQVELTPHADEA